MFGQSKQNAVWNRSQESYIHNAHISRPTCLSFFHTVASYGPNLTASNNEYQAKWKEHSQAQCQFINHIIHTQYPEDEPRNLQWEVHKLPPQILRLKHVNTKEGLESWIMNCTAILASLQQLFWFSQTISFIKQCWLFLLFCTPVIYFMLPKMSVFCWQ